MIPWDNLDALCKLAKSLATQYDKGSLCYDGDGELVADTEYDDIIRTLKEKRPSFFEKGTTSPSDYEPTGDLITHNPPMTSISKADGPKKVEIYKKWIKDCCDQLGYEYPPKPGRFAQSYKHDGVAIRVNYKKGKLVSAGLRSRSGLNGIDVTANAPYVMGIPKQLKLPLTLSIGGELECHLKDFEKVQKALEEAGEELRANPRNHTYGAINQQKDPSKTEEGFVSFAAYNITGFDEAHEHYKTEVERAKWANTELLPDKNFVQLRPHKFEDLQAMEDGVPNLDFEVDGAVLKVNNLEDQEQLGHRGDDPTAEPNGALAWKFTEKSAVGKVKELEFNASRTGKVPPVAILETPLELAGTKVTRVTLSNIGWAQRMGVGVGSEVEVIKAGKIIPKIIKVISGHVKKIPHPKNCPACKQALEVVDGHDGNVDLLCKNADCSAKKVIGIVFYLKSMEAKGLGEGKVERLLGSGKVQDLPDLYKLTVEDLVHADFSAREALLALATIHMVKPSKDDHKLTVNIMDAKGRKKKVPAWQFFAALGISGAGRTVGKALINHYHDFDKIRHATAEQLLEVDGVGDVTSEAIAAYFKKNNTMVGRLLDQIELEMPKTGKLTGKTFVLSGTLDQGKSYWEKRIQDLGGTISSNVGSKTDYLVAGPGSEGKSDAAKAKGVPIIDTKALEKML